MPTSQLLLFSAGCATDGPVQIRDCLGERTLKHLPTDSEKKRRSARGSAPFFDKGTYCSSGSGLREEFLTVTLFFGAERPGEIFRAADNACSLRTKMSARGHKKRRMRAALIQEGDKSYFGYIIYKLAWDTTRAGGDELVQRR